MTRHLRSPTMFVATDDGPFAIVLTPDGRYLRVPRTELPAPLLADPQVLDEPVASSLRQRPVPLAVQALLAVETILTNLAMQALLRRKGWTTISDTLVSDTQVVLRAGDVGSEEVTTQVLRATRLASAVPLVDPNCKVMSLTIRRMLRRRNVPCRLVLTGSPTLFEPHLFTETATMRVDPAYTSADAPRFRMVGFANADSHTVGD